MKIVVAPNAFKGTLSAGAAAAAIAEGIRRAMPDAETVLSPVADGGDGTLDILLGVLGGARWASRVSGPLGEPVEAAWGLVDQGRTAVIEAAQAFGLALVPPRRRNPGLTTSRGVGELIAQGLERGIRQFILAVGGSANNDGGAGMMRALGVRFLDGAGRELGEGGLELRRVASIDDSARDPRLAECTFRVWCDSSVPLTGPLGVSLMYSPGKGASPEVAARLEDALVHYAACVERTLGTSIADVPSAGSGGGVVGAARAFLDARVVLGCEAVLDAVGFARHLSGAALVVTGEGQVDEQTIYQKAPIGVAAAAQRRGVPVLGICARAGSGWEKVLARGMSALAIVAEPGGWARPGSVVDEGDLAEAAADIFAQLARARTPRGGGLPLVPRFLRSSGATRGGRARI